MNTGKTRTQIINHLIDQHECKTYLEIGVQYGVNFRAVKCEYKRGIDPEPMWNDGRIYKMTSDEYFDHKPYISLVGNLECVFIDGMHTAEQVIRDFTNAVNCRARVIVLHDCMPTDETTTLIPRVSRVWHGTTFRGWIAIRLALAKIAFPGLNAWTEPHDHGCGVVTIPRGAHGLVMAHLENITPWEHSFKDFARWGDTLLNVKSTTP